jgi:glycosyltransferase involved in cell wall biosynthesis
MRIALLVTDSLGVRGGAEVLVDGLAAALRAAHHVVDVVALSFDESSVAGILEGYEHARQMDLSAYDAVISTKAPTFSARHPNHILYLVHTVRVFYDMFDSWVDGHGDRWFERDRIRELDYEAISSIPERRRFAIGEEVSHRLWDAIALRTSVVHPALQDADAFHQGPFEHFLHVGRLHAWKRTDLVIQAYRRTSTRLPLLVAGTGPEQDRLRELAGDDERIRFLGQVGRAELIDLYSRALAVPFVPVREDFGYVTVEAMLSGKPVITATDSGEAARLVAQAACGLIVPPDVASLTAALQRLAASPEDARRLGHKGIEHARRITWPSIVRRLLESLPARSETPKSADQRRTRLLIVDSQPIEPPVAGGRLRLWGLYSHLPDDIEPRYVGTYDWPGPAYRAIHHNGKLLEITVPQSHDHFKAHYDLVHREPKLTVDVTFPRLSHLSQGFVKRVRDEAAWADAIVFSHPWVYPHLAGRPEIAGKPLIYDAQNVEGFLKRTMLGSQGLAGEVASEIERLEARLCEAVDAILACSDDDAALFSYFYRVPAAKLHVVPNGVDTTRIHPPDQSTRASSRAHLALTHTGIVGIFIGSDYFPNVEAARFICRDLAPRCPEIQFLIVGGCGAHLDTREVPTNVVVLGRVDDATRDAAYAAADIAVNPITTGGGTNIKMLDYFAAGLPVLSTPVGARGLEPEGNPGLIVTHLASFPASLAMLANDRTRCLEMASAARDFAQQRFDWRQISASLAKAVHDLLRRPSPIGHGRIPASSVRPVRLRLAVMSTWETRCGIADYSRFLVEALPPSVEWKIYAEASSCGVPDSARVARNWHYGLPDVESLKKTLLKDRPDVLLVQHNPSFFREDGIEKLSKLRDATGIPIAMTLHAGSGLRVTPEFSPILDTFDRIYVHRASDAVWLRDRGCRVEATVIQHGTLEFPDRSIAEARERAGFPKDAFMVAHFGYLRPHKGTLELIEAFDILAPYFPALRLLLRCAEYPSGDSRAYRAICDRRISASPFHLRIHASFQHLPIEQVGVLLQAADVTALPYWSTRESSSAAVRTAISARRPVLVSASPIFEDLDAAAEIAADCSPHPLANAIKRLMLDGDLLHRATERVRSLARHSAWHHVAAALSTDLILRVARTETTVGEDPCQYTRQ